MITGVVVYRLNANDHWYEKLDWNSAVKAQEFYVENNYDMVENASTELSLIDPEKISPTDLTASQTFPDAIDLNFTHGEAWQNITWRDERLEQHAGSLAYTVLEFTFDSTTQFKDDQWSFDLDLNDLMAVGFFKAAKSYTTRYTLKIIMYAAGVLVKQGVNGYRLKAKFTFKHTSMPSTQYDSISYNITASVDVRYVQGRFKSELRRIQEFDEVDALVDTIPRKTGCFSFLRRPRK